MQAMNHPLPASLLSIFRQAGFFIVLLYLLDALFGLAGIAYTQTAADYLAVGVSLFLFRRCWRAFSARAAAKNEEI